jgi:hypothetical protein
VSRCCLTWLWKWGSTSRLVISKTLYWEVGWRWLKWVRG